MKASNMMTVNSTSAAETVRKKCRNTNTKCIWKPNMMVVPTDMSVTALQVKRSRTLEMKNTKADPPTPPNRNRKILSP